MKKMFSFLVVIIGLLLSGSFAIAQDNTNQPPPAGSPLLQPYQGQNYGLGNNMIPNVPQQPIMQPYQSGINDVDKQGQNFNNIPGGPGMMGPNNFGPNVAPGGNNMMGQQQYGPSDEEIAKMEEKQKIMEKQAITQMQRGVKQFASQIKQVEKRVATFKAKGVTAPAELTDALTKAKAMIDQGNTAENIDTIQEAMDEIQSVGQVIQEQMPQLERLSQLPKVLKQANLEINRLNREFTKVKTKAARSKIDISGIVSSYDEKLAGLKNTVTEADGMYKSGQADEAFDKMEGFFDSVQEAWDEQQKLQAVSNFATYVKDIQKGITNAKRQVKQFVLKKIDVTELNSIIAEAESKLNELKGLMKAQPIDTETMMSSLDTLEELRNSFEDKVKELGGVQEELPGIQLKNTSDINLNFLGKVQGVMDNIYTNKQAIDSKKK